LKKEFHTELPDFTSLTKRKNERNSKPLKGII